MLWVCDVDQRQKLPLWTSLWRLPAGLLVLISVVIVSVSTYLPAVDNSFISDDFTLFPFLKALDQRPLYILEAPSELFRLMSYVYFQACFKAFVLNPAPYYWASIALHALISFLVYLLVWTVTGHSVAAWSAAVFFAAYERHQEAVMWISAANEIILTLNCLLFLLLWERTQSGTGSKRVNVAIALLVFVMALFSKEAAVALVPLVIVGLVLRGYSRRDVLRKSLPLWVILSAYIWLWLSYADRNFFITDGHYALGMHFFPVYARSLVRLLSPALPFLVMLLIIRYRARSSRTIPAVNLKSATELPGSRSYLFFAALLVLSIVPYSFLTYLNHIPSRNTYLPSVGLAGLIGILFAMLYSEMVSVWAKRVCIFFLLAIAIGNSAYIWLKKEPQFRERAAPTRELIDVLNGPAVRSVDREPIYVCGFPLHPWIGSEAVAGFTPFRSTHVVFTKACNELPAISVLLHWDASSGRYKVNLP